MRVRNRDGAVDAVDAHRGYQAALGRRAGLRRASRLALTASLGAAELATLRAAHERADWVVTLDRNLGVDLSPRRRSGAPPYILDYAPDFLEGLGPRLTVTTTHRGEVAAAARRRDGRARPGRRRRVGAGRARPPAGGVGPAGAAPGRAVELATEAVSLAALIAHLRRRGELDGCFVVPVDAHQEVFGTTGAATRACGAAT